MGSGNLVGIPWRVALALQADGWILRQDIIWHKLAPMPESVRNRCTKAHEYVFLLTKKGSGYFYDQEAIREKAGGYKTGGAMNYRPSEDSREFLSQNKDSEYHFSNKRSVWTISSHGYEGAHFATFPPKLIEPMIKAGTSEKGCCAKCGAPWKRVVEEKKLTRDRPNDYVKRTGEPGTGNATPNSAAGVETKTVGWESGCECGAEVVPCTVLDPFMGSGTTSDACVQLGRRSVGIELNEKYIVNNQIPRVEGSLLSIPAYRGMIRREAKKVQIGKVMTTKKP